MTAEDIFRSLQSRKEGFQAAFSGRLKIRNFILDKMKAGKGIIWGDLFEDFPSDIVSGSL